MTTKIIEPNGDIVLTLKLGWSDISTQYEKEVQKAVDEAELQGFRKGKAPRDLVEPRLDKTKLYSQAIEGLLPQVYNDALKEHDLHPIIQPKVKLEKGEEGQDWEFSATTCEIPEATLPKDYEAGISKLEIKEGDDKLTKIVEYLRTNSEVKVPDVLVEEESNHRIAALADNVTRLGMNIESYLQAKKLTSSDLKAQTATEARADLEVEFVLEKVRTTKELKERKETLDFLLSLV